jgi:hypothetical protein
MSETISNVGHLKTKMNFLRHFLKNGNWIRKRVIQNLVGGFWARLMVCERISGELVKYHWTDVHRIHDEANPEKTQRLPTESNRGSAG